MRWHSAAHGGNDPFSAKIVSANLYVERRVCTNKNPSKERGYARYSDAVTPKSYRRATVYLLTYYR